jgi:hypothetical protein
MAKQFRSTTGGHVSIYVPWRADPIEVPAEGTYETDDKQEIEALQAADQVADQKSGGKGEASGSKDEPDAKGKSGKS